MNNCSYEPADESNGSISMREITNPSKYTSGEGEGSADIGGNSATVVDTEVKASCSDKHCNSKLYLLSFCVLILFQRGINGGYLSSIVTNLEQRFGLTSTESGIIIAGYEMVAIPCTLVSGYLFSHANRPRVLAVGAFLIGLGMVIFSIPHFVVEDYVYAEAGDSESLCQSANATASACRQTTRIAWTLIFFIGGHMLVGVGSSPVWTIGETYLFDNTSRKTFPIYSGINNAMGALGPVIAYLLGSLFLSIYVHPSHTPPFDSSDTRWIGAWWVGCLVLGGGAFLSGFPLLFFPRHMSPCQMGLKAEVRKVPKNMTAKKRTFKDLLQDVKRSSRHAFASGLWWLSTVTTIFDGASLILASSFLVKTVETLFLVSSSRASLLGGGILVPGAFFGILIGGIIIRKAQLQTKGILRFQLTFNLIGTLCAVPLFFLHCPSPPVAGVNHPYPATGSAVSMTDSCHSKCTCSLADFSPVCSGDVTFFTACHAGCMAFTEGQYSNCSCAAGSGNATVATGVCQDDSCWFMYPWLGFAFAAVFFAIMPFSGDTVLTMTSVPPEFSSVAISLKLFITRLIGYMPTPIYAGAALDATCQFFREGCDGGQGSCTAYDNASYSYVFVGILIGTRCISIMCSVVGNIMWRPLANIGDTNSRSLNADSTDREDGARL